MEDKIFVGSGKSFGNYGGINISLCQEEIQEHWKASKNGKHYINLTISKKKNADQYGNTHYVAVNTYSKDSNVQEKKVEEEKPQKEIDEEELNNNNNCVEQEDDYINPDDIPF